jgi:hypothetical protein
VSLYYPNATSLQALFSRNPKYFWARFGSSRGDFAIILTVILILELRLPQPQQLPGAGLKRLWRAQSSCSGNGIVWSSLFQNRFSA